MRRGHDIQTTAMVEDIKHETGTEVYIIQFMYNGGDIYRLRRQ